MVRETKKSEEQSEKAHSLRELEKSVLLLLMVGVFFLTGAAYVASAKNLNFSKEQSLTNLENQPPWTERTKPQSELNSQLAEEKAKVPQKPERTTITISAVGDCTLGTDPAFWYETSFNREFDIRQDYGYFFQNVKSVLEKDDLTIANLETTLTVSDNKVDKSHQGMAFWFKGDPSYARILKEGSIEAVNLANNHSMDYMNQGFEDTIASLQAEEILHFGYELKAIQEIKGFRVGMLGYNDLGPVEEGNDLEAIKQKVAEDVQELRQNCQLVIVSYHWGQEGHYAPNQRQIALGRFTIDAGADLVLGHHPHVIQPVEIYNQKAIVYSLANFSFGGHSNPYDKDTFIFQQTFTLGRDGEMLEIGSATAISCSASSVNWRNDYCPTILEGVEAERVLRRTGLY